MGCRLRQVLGFDQFRIFDRRSEIAGTWTANSYPGIACDGQFNRVSPGFP
jgi:cation diffusion facilitator CzcD-associated flavoprotein CzcO